MRLLLIADEESKFLWDFFQPELIGPVDLILSAGDLKSSYLEFLVTMLHAPLVYVHGNHDARLMDDPPGGCTCADNTVVTEKGLRIAGLGGCMGFNPQDPLQFSERQMAGQVRRLDWQIKRTKGIDILLTHSPAKGMGDGEDVFHQGFACFLPLIEKRQPRLHVFGHQHKRYGLQQSQETLATGRTQHLNPCGYQLFEW